MAHRLRCPRDPAFRPRPHDMKAFSNQLVARNRSCEYERGKRGRRRDGVLDEPRCCTRDGGCLALRNRLAEAGSKPPRGLAVADRTQDGKHDSFIVRNAHAFSLPTGLRFVLRHAAKPGPSERPHCNSNALVRLASPGTRWGPHVVRGAEHAALLDTSSGDRDRA